MCEAVTILNNCSKIKTTQRKKAVGCVCPHSTQHHRPPRSTRRAGASQQTPSHPGKNQCLHLSPIFLVHPKPSRAPTQPGGPTAVLKGSSQQTLLHFWRDGGKKSPQVNPGRSWWRGPRFTCPSGSSSSRGQRAQQRHLLCSAPPVPDRREGKQLSQQQSAGADPSPRDDCAAEGPSE